MMLLKMHTWCAKNAVSTSTCQTRSQSRCYAATTFYASRATPDHSQGNPPWSAPLSARIPALKCRQMPRRTASTCSSKFREAVSPLSSGAMLTLAGPYNSMTSGKKCTGAQSVSYLTGSLRLPRRTLRGLRSFLSRLLISRRQKSRRDLSKRSVISRSRWRGRSRQEMPRLRISRLSSLRLSLSRPMKRLWWNLQSSCGLQGLCNWRLTGKLSIDTLNS